MTDAQRQLLEEAASSLAAAEILFSTGYPGYAASRAYYSMFYVAQAFLLAEGLSFSKHAGVIAGFGKHIALAGKVPIETHRWLIEAQELRQAGDYLDSKQHHARPGAQATRSRQAVSGDGKATDRLNAGFLCAPPRPLR